MKIEIIDKLKYTFSFYRETLVQKEIDITEEILECIQTCEKFKVEYEYTYNAQVLNFFIKEQIIDLDEFDMNEFIHNALHPFNIVFHYAYRGMKELTLIITEHKE